MRCQDIYEMIDSERARSTELAIYHLISTTSANVEHFFKALDLADFALQGQTKTWLQSVSILAVHSQR